MVFTQSFEQIHKFFQTRSISSFHWFHSNNSNCLTLTLVINGQVDESTAPRMHFWKLESAGKLRPKWIAVLNYPREAIPVRHEIVQNRNRPTRHPLQSCVHTEEKDGPVWCLGSAGITHAINPPWNDDGRRWSPCLINRRARLFSGITML